MLPRPKRQRVENRQSLSNQKYAEDQKNAEEDGKETEASGDRASREERTNDVESLSRMRKIRGSVRTRSSIKQVSKTAKNSPKPSSEKTPATKDATKRIRKANNNVATEDKSRSITRKSPRKKREEIEEPMGVVKDIVKVPVGESDGWKGRWNSLMIEHQTSTANALAEILIKAYDACTCRLSIDNPNVPETLQSATLETSILDTSTADTSVLHASNELLDSPDPKVMPDSSPNGEIGEIFVCKTCKKTFDSAQDLQVHNTSHCRNVKTVLKKEPEEKEMEEKEEQEIEEADRQVQDGENEQEKTPQNAMLETADFDRSLLEPDLENIAKELTEDDKSDLKSSVIVIKKRSRTVKKDEATGEIIGEIVVTGKEKRKIKLKRERCYTCEFCGKEFSNSQLLKYHIRTHTGERPLQCNTCGKRFIDNKALLVHSRIHSGIRPYSCSHCQLTFTQASNLKRHLTSVHDKKKQFLCQFCDARFARLEHVQTHERSHLGIRPFSCVVCGQEFASRQHLQRHAVMHTNFRPFQCTICERSFNRKDRLLQHEAIHRAEEEERKRADEENAAREKFEVDDPRFSRIRVQGITCCIMKDEQDPEPAAKTDSEPTTDEPTTPNHILKSIRKLTRVPTPQQQSNSVQNSVGQPGIRVLLSNDPTVNRDPNISKGPQINKVQNLRGPILVKSSNIGNILNIDSGSNLNSSGGTSVNNGGSNVNVSGPSTSVNVSGPNGNVGGPNVNNTGLNRKTSGPTFNVSGPNLNVSDPNLNSTGGPTIQTVSYPSSGASKSDSVNYEDRKLSDQHVAFEIIDAPMVQEYEQQSGPSVQYSEYETQNLPVSVDEQGDSFEVEQVQSTAVGGTAVDTCEIVPQDQVHYVSASQYSADKMALDTMLSTVEQVSEQQLQVSEEQLQQQLQQQQHHHQQQQQQGIVYYRNRDGDLVDISHPSFGAEVEPVLYQEVEIEQEEENGPQQQVYVVQQSESGMVEEENMVMSTETAGGDGGGAHYAVLQPQ